MEESMDMLENESGELDQECCHGCASDRAQVVSSLERATMSRR